MEPLDWIDSLARQARREAVPDLHVIVPRVPPAALPLPRALLSLSAFGSLAAACLLLILGLRAQQSTPVTSSPSASSSTDATSTLFSPIKVGLQ